MKISKSQLQLNYPMDLLSATPRAKSSNMIPIATWNGANKLTKERSNSSSSTRKIGWYFRWELIVELSRGQRGTLKCSSRERVSCLGGSRSAMCDSRRRAIFWSQGIARRSISRFGTIRLWNYFKCYRCRVWLPPSSPHRNWIWY